MPDLPEPGLGPLGGLNAALHYAARSDASHVLSAGVDIPNLPHDLGVLLSGEGAAIVENQPVVGLWPVTLTPVLAAFIADGGRSLYRFADHVGARQIALKPPLLNVNRPADIP